MPEDTGPHDNRYHRRYTKTRGYVDPGDQGRGHRLQCWTGTSIRLGTFKDPPVAPSRRFQGPSTTHMPLNRPIGHHGRLQGAPEEQQGRVIAICFVDEGRMLLIRR